MTPSKLKNYWHASIQQSVTEGFTHHIANQRCCIYLNKLDKHRNADGMTVFILIAFSTRYGLEVLFSHTSNIYLCNLYLHTMQLWINRTRINWNFRLSELFIRLFSGACLYEKMYFVLYKKNSVPSDPVNAKCSV